MNYFLPQLSIAVHRTGDVAPVGEVLHVPASAGGVQAVDQVRGVNVGQRLGGENSHTAGATEVVHQVSLSSVTAENVGNLRGTAAFR